MREQYKTCPYCGAHLDPEEKCDCREAEQKEQEQKQEQENKLAKAYFALALFGLLAAVYCAVLLELNHISFSCALLGAVISGCIALYSVVCFEWQTSKF